MTDPVCGAVVDADAAAETQYEGSTYRFCSEACYQAFMLDPEGYTEDRPEV